MRSRRASGFLSAQTARRKNSNKVRLTIEALEDRTVPTGFSRFIDVTDIGGAAETPIVGDWNGDGWEDIGVYIPNATGARWALKLNQRNGTFTESLYHDSHNIGGFGEIPIVGDFDGDGYDDIGVYVPNGSIDARWVVKLNNQNGTFASSYYVDQHNMGGADDTPVVGDFNGDGRDDIGVYIPDGNVAGRWAIKLNTGPNSFSSALYIDARTIGGSGEYPLVGDWNGDTYDDIGVYIPLDDVSAARWALVLNTGDASFAGPLYIDAVEIGGFGEIGFAGDFNADNRDDIGIHIQLSHRWVVETTPSTGGVFDNRNRLVWVNRGEASDGFDATFGAGQSANTARAVVDAAIRHWERALTSFNTAQYYSANNNRLIPAGTIALTFELVAFENSDTLGSASTSDVDSNGFPRMGTIRFNQALVADWFIDPTPDDNSEFEGTIENAFAGRADVGSPAHLRTDFYSVVSAELNHILGLSSNANLRLHTQPLYTNTGVTDPFGVGTLYDFNGPRVRTLLTSNNGGQGGTDRGRPVHVAGSTASAAGVTGAIDTGNATLTPGRRVTPSNLNALFYADAYGYGIDQPERFGTFYSILNESTGELLVRDGSASSNDTISISRSGRELIVSVDLGTDVPGTGPTDAVTSRYPLGAIRSLRIKLNGGTDSLFIDSHVAAVVEESFANNNVITLSNSGVSPGRTHQTPPELLRGP